MRFYSWPTSAQCFCFSDPYGSIDYNLFSYGFSNKFMDRFMLSVTVDWKIVLLREMRKVEDYLLEDMKKQLGSEE